MQYIAAIYWLASLRKGLLVPLRPKTLELAILGRLMQGPCHGYVLRKLAYVNQQAAPSNEQDFAEMVANVRWLAFNGSGPVRAQASKLYMEVKGYIKKGDEGAEAHANALIDALKEFSQSTHP